MPASTVWRHASQRAGDGGFQPPVGAVPILFTRFCSDVSERRTREFQASSAAVTDRRYNKKAARVARPWNKFKLS
jgi:hypothetical protein